MTSPAISAPTLLLQPAFSLPSSQNASWQGRLCSIASEKIKILSKYIHKIAYAIFFPLKLIFANTYATSSICKKLTQNVLPMLELLKGLPNYYAKLKTVFGSTFNIIDTVRIFETANCFLNGKYKNLGLIGTAAKTFLSAGYSMEGLSWFSSIGLIPTLSVGSTRVFGRTINGTLGLAHAFFAVDTIFKIPAATNDVQKKTLMLELAKHIGELTLSLMMLAGRISTVSLGAAGLTCIGLEILNLIYKERYENTMP